MQGGKDLIESYKKKEFCYVEDLPDPSQYLLQIQSHFQIPDSI